MNIGEWFSSNRFSASEFSGIPSLVKLKKKQGKKISCVIPTLNEEDNVGKVIAELQKLVRKNLVDEILVVDSGSTDRTRSVAEKSGADFYYASDILKNYGRAKGKGENLWKSLFVAVGDIIAWVDADIKNISEKFVYGLAGPILTRGQIGFTKAFYQRPLDLGSGLRSLEGGRVTELLMRPLYNLYFPQLAGFIQPLSGEYAGRREILEKISFFTGYGVEMGMLIDIERKFGLEAMAQVDLDERVHRNRPLNELSKMSFEILQAFSEKANALGVFVNLEKINSIYTLVEPSSSAGKTDYYLHKKHMPTFQRPPMVAIKEYREKFGYSATA